MDVIVIGAGAAGIAALAPLHEANLKILALEASDRIGGRICSVVYGDKVIDLGAAWCHGEKDNVVYKLANPLDLLGRPDPDEKFFILSNGNLLPVEDGNDILNAISSIIDKADKNNTISISECIKNGIPGDSLLRRDLKLTRGFVEWFERNNHVGGQIISKTSKSLKGLEESWTCEGEFMLNWKGKGYKTILDVLLKKLPDKSKELPVPILFNKEVETIKWKTGQGVSDVGKPLVQIKCTDGSLYAAKSVIVTISVGVLKERQNRLFNPPLPEEKVNTINNLQMCVLDKIYIEFQSQWWEKSATNFSIIWRQEDKEKFSPNETWLTEVFGFQTVDHPNILLGWIYGNGAEDMEKLTLESVKSGIIKLLNHLFKDKFQLTPVVSVLRSQWASNPLARGSYAYRSVLIEENGGSASILSEPLYHGDGSAPVVCFAGEATSHHHHGAVHGAVESGLREAERIIKSLK